MELLLAHKETISFHVFFKELGPIRVSCSCYQHCWQFLLLWGPCGLQERLSSSQNNDNFNHPIVESGCHKNSEIVIAEELGRSQSNIVYLLLGTLGRKTIRKCAIKLIIASSVQISDPAGLPENHPLWVVCTGEEGKNEFASFHLPVF